ncbi:emerin homolog 1-like [Mya arenaria]|uniref:emerin homolog 1-like n=1 Tax=Mya arenaria TaxID=6604 RepID=UPI0022DEEAA3|nr:emerin homolog 1-like [Mya arenaria]XP_052781873.1 emerin homolog 1-like [Mya arenaria]
MATDIAQLSDEDLRQQLQECGVNVGPITSSTRLFYEKKLGKVMDSGGNPPPPESDTEESEEEEEEEEEDEEVQINYRPPVQPKPVRPQITSTPVAAEAPRTYKPIVQARTATPTMPATRRNVGRTEAAYTPATSPPTNAASKSGGGGGVGMWLKLIFLLVVAFLVYLVVINMNPNAESKIPLSLEDDS